ncbi:MAG: hypothetical protein ACI91F_000113 [Candidatus Binatia bacterium]|jgi:hypothetical protein
MRPRREFGVGEEERNMSAIQAFKLTGHGGDTSELTREPANRLMLAVLEEALVTFQRGINSPVPEQRRNFCEVDAWVASQDTDWPFSFENICSSLRLDPDYIRGGLRRLKKDGLVAKDRPKGRKLRRERIYDRRAWRGQIK